ncbi:hypothetical protein TNCV_950861 [Trichonephila clavipes]|nr:hypothetical protein TNCV_950861 [Trichonephila clavipes]
MYSTYSKPLPFAMTMVSSQSSLENGMERDLLCFLRKAVLPYCRRWKCVEQREVRGMPAIKLLRIRHIGPTPGVMVWGAISNDSSSTLVAIQIH